MWDARMGSMISIWSRYLRDGLEIYGWLSTTCSMNGFVAPPALARRN
jgi:hypothetical protein